MCVPGEQLVFVGEPAQPECWPCSDGTFSTSYSADMCDAWSECHWDEQEVVSPSATQDRICGYGSPIRQFGTAQDDRGYDIVVDEWGAVFVSGGTYGSLDGPSEGDADLFVREYTAAGDLAWGRQIASGYNESVGRLALGYGSLPYVLTTRWSPYGADSVVWTVNPYATNSVALFGEGGTDFALGPDASILFSRAANQGSNITLAELSKVDQYGLSTWAMTYESGSFVYPADLELLDDGSFVVAGSTNGPLFRSNTGIQETFVARFTEDGALIWGVQFGDTGYAHPRSIGVDSYGDVYLTGISAGASDSGSAPMVARVSSSGTLVWMSTLGPADSTLDLGDVVIDDSNRVFVAAVVFGAFGATYYGNQDAVVLQLFSDGSVGPVYQFGTPQDDWAAALAIAPDGAVFVVGGTSGTLGATSFGSVDAFIARVPIETFY